MSQIKNRASFYFILGLIAAVSSVIFVLFSGIIGVFAVFFGIISAAYWCVYFYSIKYELSENNLVTENGVFIRRTRKIALSEIVLETRIGIGKTVLVTVLRTSGGSVIVFGQVPKAR